MNTSSFVYGADGIRRQSTVNGTATDFILDNSMFVQERNHATGTSIATYLVGARGPEYRRDDATGQIRWYLYDGLGSVLGEIDPNGNITSSRKYDVYGLVRGGTNPGGTSSHKFVGQLGHPSEDNTGLIYMRARYYDPTVGSFINEDPAKQGKNWLQYANCNPVNAVDPTGTDWDWSSFAWGGGVCGLGMTFLWLLLNRAASLGVVAFGNWLSNVADALITSGRNQMGKGALAIAEGEEQDLTPGGFSYAGLAYGRGSIDCTMGAAKLALGITLKAIATYLIWSQDE